MVDAVDLRLAEDLADLAVELLGRLEVVAERLLDDHPTPAAVVALVVQPDPPELADELGELRGLRREVVEPIAPRALGVVELVEPRRERLETIRVVEIEPVIADRLPERLPGGLVERQGPTELLQRRPDLVAERVVVERSAPDRQQHEFVRQQVRPPQVVHRRDDLAMGQVAGRPEQDEDRGIRHALQAQALAEDVRRRLRPRRALALA